MPIVEGARLGPYEVLSPVGAGGMGEVYRARDTRLGRDVAIKVLPANCSTDPDRLRRFKQEACSAGALNHPNILSIYDIGAHEDAPYIVSELLDGETLRKRLIGANLPQRRVIDYALQIAHGLAAAHEKGIVHRDLKPDNIFITKDGRVKILDFGLAKLTQRDGNESQTDVPTRRVDTDPGVVLGTVGYMSPEQVRGQTVDHRSDIFSFGAILYEMLSGQRAFQGESTADTMSAILKEEPPDLSSTNHNVSPTLERLVDHCLEKNPAERFHSARDLAFALEAMSGSVATTTETVTTTAYAQPRLTRRELVSWLLSGLFLLVALSLTYLYFRSTPTNEKELTRFYVDPPEKMSFNGPTVSPDGRNLLFEVNAADGKRQLWIRSLASLAAQPIPGTEDGGQAFWSPDSRFIGFFAGGKLKKVDTYTGTTQVLADVQQSQTRGGTWSREGVIVFAVALRGGLFRVPAAGGSPTQVTIVDSSGNPMAPIWPQFLPDGHHFIYLERSMKPEETGIYIGSLDSTESKLLMHSHAAAVYAHPGYLLFLGDGRGPLASLMAQPFDVKSLQLSGEAKPGVQDVAHNPGNGRVFFSASDNGVLVYRTGFVVNRQLTWFSRTGKQLGTLGTVDFILGPSLSPDEKRLAIVRADLSKGTDIWLVDVARGTNSRFTFDPAIEGNPMWSPDGSRIVFSSNRAGVYDLYGKPSNGAGNEELLLKSNDSKYVTDWSSDGRFILYQAANAKTQMDLWALPLFDDKKPVALEQSGFNETQGKFSADGRWIAYVSNESGNNQIYVRNFPPTGGKWMVSINGGSQPRWRNDGKELFYLGPGNKLMAVQVKSDGTNFEIGTAVPLFEANIAGVTPMSGGGYVVTHDGQRFLLNLDPEESEPTPMIVVENWTALVKK